VVPGLLARDRLWRATDVGVVLLIAETTANRQQVRRHPATFGTAFPAGTVEVRRWLHAPHGSLRGIWFLRPSSQQTDMRRSGGPRRVRAPRVLPTDSQPSVGRSSPST
jgi:hypothetical protein